MAKFVRGALFWIAQAVLLLWSGAAMIMNWIGRSTIYDDSQHALGLLEKAANWLFSTPWWVPSLLAAAMAGLSVWLLRDQMVTAVEGVTRTTNDNVTQRSDTGIVNLRSGKTIEIDRSAGVTFYFTLTQHTVLVALQNPQEGVCRLIVQQGADRGFTISFTKEFTNAALVRMSYRPKSITVFEITTVRTDGEYQHLMRVVSATHEPSVTLALQMNDLAMDSSSLHRGTPGVLLFGGTTKEMATGRVSVPDSVLGWSVRFRVEWTANVKGDVAFELCLARESCVRCASREGMRLTDWSDWMTDFRVLAPVLNVKLARLPADLRDTIGDPVQILGVTLEFEQPT